MKILIVTETLDEGGAELFVLRLAEGLLAAGEEVLVVNLNRRYENKQMTARFPAVPIKRLSISFFPLVDLVDKLIRKIGIDFSFRYSMQARQVKKLAAGVDIIHTHYIQVDHLVTSIRKNASFKQVVTVHGDYSSQYAAFQKGQLKFWLNLDKKMVKLSAVVDQWVVIAEEHRSFLKEKMNVPDNKIRKIYNGYPGVVAGKPVRTNEEPFTFGMVARGMEQKGWQLLIDAFLKLPGACRLILVGGSVYMEMLKSKYVGESRIIFMGFQANPIEWMRKMDVFVLPTLYPFESLPNVITEALYCGLPVIATNVGEIEKMITDEHSGKQAGFVIDFDGQQLNEQQLFERMNYLYENQEKCNEIAEIAKIAARKFNMEQCLASYREVYKSLLS